MKQTKTILITVILTLSAFATIVYTSCKKDACKGVSCLNGGTCIDGTCSCVSGWTGTNCSQMNSYIFAGTWNGNNCEGNTSYHISVGGIVGGGTDTLVLEVPYTFTSCGGMTTIVYLSGAFSNTAAFWGTNTLTFYDACGNYYVINATVDINSILNTITITFNYGTKNGTSECVFKGTK